MRYCTCDHSEDYHRLRAGKPCLAYGCYCPSFLPSAGPAGGTNTTEEGA